MDISTSSYNTSVCVSFGDQVSIFKYEFVQNIRPILKFAIGRRFLLVYGLTERHTVIWYATTWHAVRPPAAARQWYTWL